MATCSNPWGTASSSWGPWEGRCFWFHVIYTNRLYLKRTSENFHRRTSLNEILLFFILSGRLFHVLPKNCWWFLSNSVTRSWWCTSCSPSRGSWGWKKAAPALASICKGYETVIHSMEMVNCNKINQTKAYHCIYFRGFGPLPDNKFILAVEILSNQAILNFTFSNASFDPSP